MLQKYLLIYFLYLEFVLQPFYFQTLSVEFFHLDELGTSNDEMKEYMISQGYKYHSTVTARKNHANDYIFVRKDLKT